MHVFEKVDALGLAGRSWWRWLAPLAHTEAGLLPACLHRALTSFVQCGEHWKCALEALPTLTLYLVSVCRLELAIPGFAHDLER